jgi:hypothetical protein
MVSEIGLEPSIAHATYPLLMQKVEDKSTWDVPLHSLQLPLPLRCTAQSKADGFKIGLECSDTFVAAAAPSKMHRTTPASGCSGRTHRHTNGR